MSKATEHLLPPPPPVPEPIYEELITTNAETGETTSTQVLIPAAPVLPVEPEFDIVDEASKMPLEVAVACSLLSAPVERIANLAGSILVLGGGGAVEGFADALRWRSVPQVYTLPVPSSTESLNTRLDRVLSQLQQRAPQQSISPAILPPPRGLDPRLVTWRGGVVWTKLDSMSDLWIRREEWQEIGLRSIKMRMM
jgi:actin-related protein 8